MQCHECGNAVASDDRFCTACGAPLADQSETTQQIETVPMAAAPVDDTVGGDAGTEDTDDMWSDDDPIWAPTGSVDAVGHSVEGDTAADELPPTQPITAQPDDPEPDDPQPDDPQPDDTVRPRSAGATPIVTAEEVAGVDPWSDPWTNEPGVTATTTISTSPGTAELPVFPTPIRETSRFRFTGVLVFSVLGSIVFLLSLFATIVSVTSDERLVRTPETPQAFRTGDWISTNLADNVPIAGLIAVCLLVAGGIASGFGWRGGSGLAGGAGLAIAGIASLTIGLAQIPIDAAYEMAAIPSDQQFTLTITRDLGYWLLVAGGAIGVVVFFASLNDAFGDRRSGLNPWIAAVGALSGLVMAGGPLIPEGLASFSDNWYVGDAPGAPPAMLLTMRLVQLGLLALAAVIGFLSVRRWGLGIAVGGGMSSIWLTVSTLFELGENPAGPGYNNPGASSMGVHGVTIIGASALLAFALLALVAAYDQATRGY